MYKFKHLYKKVIHICMDLDHFKAKQTVFVQVCNKSSQRPESGWSSFNASQEQERESYCMYSYNS